jgi:hypothetical protein
VYGGLYADSDYLALQSQIPLLEQHPILKHQQVLLQGRGEQQPVGLEWGYARKPGHAFFVYCLEHHIDSYTKSDSAAVYVTGPVMLETCLRTYIGTTNARRPDHPLVPMTTLNNSIVIVEPKLIAPIDGQDFESTCGSWRSSNDHHSWRDDWATSTCRKELLQQGSFAVTFYTQSWNILDDKDEKEAAVKLEAKRNERKRKKEIKQKSLQRHRQDVNERSGHARRNSNHPRVARQ